MNLRLTRDVSAERDVARLRLLAAIVVGIGGVWIVLDEPGNVGWMLAAIAWLASLGWVVSYLRTRRLPNETADGLTLTNDGLHLLLGTRDDRLSWREVRGVVVDEDGLRVVLMRHEGEDFIVPPAFAGRSLEALGDDLERAWSEGMRSDLITAPVAD